MAEWKDRERPDTIVLFDVDGTLTPARRPVTKEVLEALKELRKKVVIGFVGGSDLSKQKEQLGAGGTLGSQVIDDFDFVFPENGLAAYRLGKQLASQSFIGWIGEEKYAKLVNFILKYIADLEIPRKRGTFIEFRNGMINVSPIGRNCSLQERDEYEAYDKVHHIREKFVEVLRENFPDYSLTYSIGGQISFDVFPTGWDKTYCLTHLEVEGFKEIHFFGDKTYKGGNDYEIYRHPSVTGHSVTSPDDTIRILKEIFGI
ncbi:15594_t:CDS:10 [Acaulospora morrowiae]|uniref:Phosphomannomutase n=1 Tax=Acaulospora morrowiae TaxID=94023 RepID=A0A9N8VUB9_9GLOM|nr:15594_t:CDS:10 [Acaulospora morrowiae]